jgi:hypothetical protein
MATIRIFEVMFKKCGYEVPSMILLCNLKVAMQLYRRKDVSVHVSTCTSYDFNALTPVLWEMWR